MTYETHRRSVAKSLTWRFIATITTTVLVYLFTGSFELAASVGFFDLSLKLFFYYLHERAWGGIAWGLVKQESTQK